MSGITAVFAKNRVVTREEFDSVFKAIEHRGWDGADVITHDQIALGHQHSYTTPESVGERQPIEFGGVWLTFDGRIDNRESLLEQLSVSNTALSDAELVLRAYQSLGDSFLAELIGAFAFALWDPLEEKLLLVRDKTGIRKLYYADTGDIVVAASEMQAVVEHEEVSAEMNEGLLAERLLSPVVTQGETFYTAVRTIGPGNVVTITPEDVREESYWDIWDADVEIDPSKDLAEAFLDRLRTAVTCRLRAPQMPGILLSGGLDSTSIAALASQSLERSEADDSLRSYTVVMDEVDSFGAEIDRLDAVVERFGIDSQTVPGSEHFTLKDIDLYETIVQESPVINALSTSTHHLMAEAANDGRTVLLGGHGGNMYEGNRLYYLDLLKSGRLGTFIRRARAESIDLRMLLLWFVLVPGSERIATLVRDRYDIDSGETIPPWIDEHFAERSRFADRIARSLETGFNSPSKELNYRRFFATDRQFEDATERQLSLRTGVELRFPFLDSRLLAFMFAVPPWEVIEPGNQKSLLRHSMEGILPEIVRTQQASVTFDPLVDQGIRNERLNYVRELLADSKLVERGIVDEAAFEAYVEDLLDDEGETVEVWRWISTEMWLKQWT